MTGAPGRVEVVCLGILVADVLARPVDAVPPWGALELVEEVALRGGGCALNTASALARLGTPTALVGKVGSDAFGDFLLGLLDERGVERSGVLRDAAAPTSATVALVSADGERTFLHTPGANAHLRAEELDPKLVHRGSWLHVAGALVMDGLDGEPVAEILAEARRRGHRTSLDTVFDASGRWQRLLPALPYVDLAMPALVEAQAVSGEVAPERVAAWFHEQGVAAVALTDGPRGCYVSADSFTGTLFAAEVEAVDGTGAGDAFAAGLIRGLLEGWELERAAHFGAAAGALATTAVGAFDGVADFATTLALAESSAFPLTVTQGGRT